MTTSENKSGVGVQSLRNVRWGVEDLEPYTSARGRGAMKQTKKKKKTSKTKRKEKRKFTA